MLTGYEFKEHIDNLIEAQKDREGRLKITHKDIAQAIGVSPSDFSKLFSENSKRTLYAEEALKLAQYFGITCEELLTGNSPQNTKICEQISGLSNSSISWLTDKNIKTEYINLLNTILSDRLLANTFFQTLLIYVNSPIFRVSSLSPISHKSLSFSASNELMKTISTTYMMNLLDRIKDKWNQHPKYQVSSLDRYLRNHKQSEEAKHRLKYKERQKQKIFDFEANFELLQALINDFEERKLDEYILDMDESDAIDEMNSYNKNLST